MIKYTTYVEAIEAVRKDGLELRHSSKELKDNSALVEIAMKQNTKAINYASVRLQGLHLSASSLLEYVNVLNGKVSDISCSQLMFSHTEV